MSDTCIMTVAGKVTTESPEVADLVKKLITNGCCWEDQLLAVLSAANSIRSTLGFADIFAAMRFLNCELPPETEAESRAAQGMVA